MFYVISLIWIAFTGFLGSMAYSGYVHRILLYHFSDCFMLLLVEDTKFGEVKKKNIYLKCKCILRRWLQNWGSVMADGTGVHKFKALFVY